MEALVLMVKSALARVLLAFAACTLLGSVVSYAIIRLHPHGVYPTWVTWWSSSLRPDMDLAEIVVENMVAAARVVLTVAVVFVLIGLMRLKKSPN